MNEAFWGGEESVLNLKFPAARQGSNQCSICCSVARSVEKRVGWIFAVIVVMLINTVILPIVALVPPLSEVDDSAVPDCQPPVHPRSQPLVMGHDEGRSASATDNLLEMAKHLGGGLRIEVTCRLVG